jgi:hypothetical protein
MIQRLTSVISSSQLRPMEPTASTWAQCAAILCRYPLFQVNDIDDGPEEHQYMRDRGIAIVGKSNKSGLGDPVIATEKHPIPSNRVFSREP